MKSFVGIGYSIYKHTNRVNGKCYIGQTKCEDLTRRWSAGHGYVECPYFYSAILKYGWNSFAHEILETGLSMEEANDREQFYIALYRSDDPQYGYNIRKGGQERRSFTESGLRRIIECSLGANNGNSKRVSVFDLSGKRVALCETVRQAARFIGVGVATLSRHLNKRSGTCGGYIARFEEEIDGDFLHEENVYFPNEQRSELRPVTQYDSDGKRIAVFKSRSEAAEKTGTRLEDISSCCTGKRKSANGFMWRSGENNEEQIAPYSRKKSDYAKSLARPISCHMTKDGPVVQVYKSITAAERELGTGNGTIQSAVRKGHRAVGLFWKYL